MCCHGNLLSLARLDAALQTRQDLHRRTLNTQGPSHLITVCLSLKNCGFMRLKNVTLCARQSVHRTFLHAEALFSASFHPDVKVAKLTRLCMCACLLHLCIDASRLFSSLTNSVHENYMNSTHITVAAVARCCHLGNVLIQRETHIHNLKWTVGNAHQTSTATISE